MRHGAPGRLPGQARGPRKFSEYLAPPEARDRASRVGLTAPEVLTTGDASNSSHIEAPWRDDEWDQRDLFRPLHRRVKKRTISWCEATEPALARGGAYNSPPTTPS